jgi:hypothetical protein
MNTYTQESFQKYERKRSSSKRKCADPYDTSGKHKKQSYSTQRDMKRNWEQEA